MVPGSIGVKAKVKVKKMQRIVWTPMSQPTPKAKAKVTSLSLSLGLLSPLVISKEVMLLTSFKLIEEGDSSLFFGALHA